LIRNRRSRKKSANKSSILVKAPSMKKKAQPAYLPHKKRKAVALPSLRNVGMERRW
jgi:hypothetical protein